MRRRNLLKAASLAPLVGAVPAAPQKPNHLAQLGVRPIINGAGVYTMFTGSLMRPEVVEAIESMSKTFVRLNELHDAVGKRMASMVNAPAAMVTSGCAAALTLGTAAVLTGDDPQKIQRIPDLTGMKSEVIVQKSHRFPYDHMVRNCGAKLVEVETSLELMKAISPRTAMLLFLNKSDHLGQIKMREFVELGKRAGIPTMNDCAADVPPVANLLNPIRLGFDLVCVSGGKGIRGPQSAGVLFGREDLIRAARLNSLPYSDTIGRSCKVNKEEMVGMMVALDLFLKEDHAALEKEWQSRVETMRSAVDGLAGVTPELFVPEIANSVPHIRIRLDPAKTRLTGPELMRALRVGEPSIECVPEPYVAGTAEIASWMLQPGEAEIVGRRLREILSA